MLPKSHAIIGSGFGPRRRRPQLRTRLSEERQRSTCCCSSALTIHSSRSLAAPRARSANLRIDPKGRGRGVRRVSPSGGRIDHHRSAMGWGGREGLRSEAHRQRMNRNGRAAYLGRLKRSVMTRRASNLAMLLPPRSTRRASNVTRLHAAATCWSGTRHPCRRPPPPEHQAHRTKEWHPHPWA